MRRRHCYPPRVITLKYPARCAETGRTLPAGSSAWWVYATAKAYAVDAPYAAKLAADQAARVALEDAGDRFNMAYEDRCAAACGL